MSTVWKWVLGVVAVLVISGLIVAGFLFWWGRSPMLVNRLTGQPPAVGTPAPNAPQGQQQGRQFWFDQDRGYRRYHWGGGMPMMGGRVIMRGGAFHPFGGFFGGMLGGLFRLFIPLLILAIVAFIFYHIGRSAGAASRSTPPAPPSSPPQTPLPARKVAKT
jgi:hypothetical protein